MKKAVGEAEICDYLEGIDKTCPLFYNLSHNTYRQIRNCKDFKYRIAYEAYVKNDE